MARFHRLHATLGLIGLLTGTAIAANDWSVLRTVSGNLANGFYVAHFSDALHGVVLTGTPTIFANPNGLKTSNGGTTWDTLPGSTLGFAPYTGSFPTPLTGYVTGQTGSNVKTNYIAKTTDGGNSWQSVNSPLSSTVSVRVLFGTADIGFATGAVYFIDSTSLYRTTNGGGNWTKIRTLGFNSMSALVFPSPSSGVAVGSAGVAWRTIDTGKTWVQVSTGSSNSLGSLACPLPAVCYAAGSSGTLLKTSDSGKTWTPLVSGVTKMLRALQFVDSATGYAAGDGGTILRTTNAGATWTSMTTGTTTDLYDLSFPDGGTGYAAGGTQILKYDTTKPLVAPTPKTPAQGSINVAESPVLTWTTSPGATSYGVQVALDSAFSLILLNDSLVTDTSYSIGPLATSTKYYWRVKARNANTTSAYSSIVSFIVGSPTPPAAPVLSAPAANALSVGLSPSLSWSASSGATRYRVQLATDSLFVALVVDDSTVSGLSKAVGPLANGTRYFWRVSATAGVGTGPWSLTRAFTTIPAIPTAPAPLTPAQDSTGLPTTLLLTWSAPSGATSYRLQVATDSNFNSLVLTDSTLTTTSRTVGPLATLTRFYWRVKAQNIAGASAYSSARSFTTRLEPPTSPAPLFPAQDSAGLPPSLNLVWGASATAATYRIVVATDSAFATKVLDDSTLAGLFKAIGPLLPQTKYYWKVRAQNAAGTSTYSATRRFTTRLEAPTGLSYRRDTLALMQGIAMTPDTAFYSGIVSLFTIAPALPTGLKLDSLTGILSGTPTVPGTNTTYTVTASNAAGSIQKFVRIGVTIAPPTGLSYRRDTLALIQNVAMTPDSAFYSGVAALFTVSPALPAGLKIDSTNGILSGTPTAPSAPATYTVTASNAGGSTQKTLRIGVTIAPPSALSYRRDTLALTLGVPLVPDTASVTGTVTRYSISPSLPAGLSLDSLTGILSGTPTALSAAATYTVTASNAGGSIQTLLRVAIGPVALRPGVNGKPAFAYSTVSGQLTYTLTGPADVHLRLLDVRGQEVWGLRAGASGGTHTIRIPVETLDYSLYVLDFRAGSERRILRILPPR